MIIKQTTIYECFCPSCHAGQMEQIFSILFESKQSATDLIEQVITCKECGTDNTVEDVLLVYPASFVVGSAINMHKGKQAKVNEDMYKWLKQ